MSFSRDVKDEIAKKLPQKRKDRVSFLAAMFMQQGYRNSIGEKEAALYFSTEKDNAAFVCFTLLKKTFNIGIDCRVRITHTENFKLKISGKEALELSDALCVEGDYERLDLSDAESRKNFVKGAFVCTGFLNDPKNSYHMEIVCTDRNRADFLASQIAFFGINPGVICRKNHFVLYIKDGSNTWKRICPPGKGSGRPSCAIPWPTAWGRCPGSCRKWAGCACCIPRLRWRSWGRCFRRPWENRGSITDSGSFPRSPKMREEFYEKTGNCGKCEGRRRFPPYCTSGTDCKQV